jgi:hypothetical protein
MILRVANFEIIFSSELSAFFAKYMWITASRKVRKSIQGKIKEITHR